MKTASNNRFAQAVADHEDFRTFAFFSANLQKLMPAIPYNRHPALFMEANNYARMAMDDTHNMAWAATYRPSAELLAGMQNPGIIASFHTGPYRLVCTWLARKGIPITIVISADVEKKQTDRNRQVYKQVVNDEVTAYEYLVAEDPLVLRKMIGALKRGRYLVCYIDGHTGVNNNRQGRTSMVMDFMAHQLRVKTGAAELARLARVPIYPLLAYFDEQNHPVLKRFDTLWPCLDGNNGSEAVADRMRRLYGHLHDIVARYPMQWEGWFYIQHDLVHTPGLADGNLFQYYLPFKVADRHFLLHKESFSAFPISPQIYQKLKERV